MRTVKLLILVSAALLGFSLTASAAEQDSAYRWGRWAVLSPAAGGTPPYVAAQTPGADFNARPGDASEFQPGIASVAPEPTGGAQPPAVVPNPPGAPPPTGSPRDTTPVVVPNPPASPPSGGPRG